MAQPYHRNASERATLAGHGLTAQARERNRRRVTTVELDLSGLKCPLPALRTRKALARLRGGAVLRVICTDPLAAIDIPALAAETNSAIELIERGARLVFRIAKNETASS